MHLCIILSFFLKIDMLLLFRFGVSRLLLGEHMVAASREQLVFRGISSGSPSTSSSTSVGTTPPSPQKQYGQSLFLSCLSSSGAVKHHVIIRRDCSAYFWEGKMYSSIEEIVDDKMVRRELQLRKPCTRSPLLDLLGGMV
tara:strand:- start:1830 stop:2249 length:420 start_codon:yes stop_codon:yes gene_type:complete